MAADLKQCEAEKLGGSFMTLGPRKLDRCKEKPAVLVYGRPVIYGETKTDQPVGEMSMCNACFEKYREVADAGSFHHIRLALIR